MKMTTETKDKLGSVIAVVFDNSKIFSSRNKWAEYLGVVPATIHNWIKGKSNIDEDSFDRILWCLEKDSPTRDSLLNTVYGLAEHRMSEIAPDRPQKYSTKELFTLGAYSRLIHALKPIGAIYQRLLIFRFVEIVEKVSFCELNDNKKKISSIIEKLDSVVSKSEKVDYGFEKLSERVEERISQIEYVLRESIAELDTHEKRSRIYDLLDAIEDQVWGSGEDLGTVPIFDDVRLMNLSGSPPIKTLTASSKYSNVTSLSSVNNFRDDLNRFNVLTHSLQKDKEIEIECEDEILILLSTIRGEELSTRRTYEYSLEDGVRTTLTFDTLNVINCKSRLVIHNSKSDQDIDVLIVKAKLLETCPLEQDQDLKISTAPSSVERRNIISYRQTKHPRGLQKDFRLRDAGTFGPVHLKFLQLSAKPDKKLVDYFVNNHPDNIEVVVPIRGKAKILTCGGPAEAPESKLLYFPEQEYLPLDYSSNHFKAFVFSSSIRHGFACEEEDALLLHISCEIKADRRARRYNGNTISDAEFVTTHI